MGHHFFISSLVLILLASDAFCAAKKIEQRKPASANAIAISGTSARQLFLALLETGAEFGKLPNGSDEIYAYEVLFTPLSEEGAANELVKVEIKQDRRQVSQRAGGAKQLWQSLSALYPKGLHLNGKTSFGIVVCNRLLNEGQEMSYAASDALKAIYTEDTAATKLYSCKVDRK